jgi:hypothetical protein
MPQAGFGPTIPASERPQTHALDRAATGIGIKQNYWDQNFENINRFLIKVSNQNRVKILNK